MGIDINSLTIGELKEIAKIAGALGACKHEHKESVATSDNHAIGKYCIVRCQKAGVHAGIVTELNGDFIVLSNSRRMWYWKSKFTLSEAAKNGIDSNNSKIAEELAMLIIPTCDVAEVIPMSDAAKKTIQEARIYVP